MTHALQNENCAGTARISCEACAFLGLNLLRKLFSIKCRGSVIDTATNTVTATVNVGLHPYGVGYVAVTPDGTKVYVANMGSAPVLGDLGIVSVIDTATNTVTATVNVGIYPDGVAVNPTGTRVYVASSAYGTAAFTSTLFVIDTATNNITATVPVGNGPVGVAVSPDGKKVYVANFFSNTTSVIDTKNNTVTATVPVGPYPSGVAVSPDGTKVYVVNVDGTVSVIDTTNNTIIVTLKVGDAHLVIGQFIGKGPAK